PAPIGGPRARSCARMPSIRKAPERTCGEASLRPSCRRDGPRGGSRTPAPALVENLRQLFHVLGAHSGEPACHRSNAVQGSGVLLRELVDVLFREELVALLVDGRGGDELGAEVGQVLLDLVPLL